MNSDLDGALAQQLIATKHVDYEIRYAIGDGGSCRWGPFGKQLVHQLDSWECHLESPSTITVEKEST